ncbi:uncharacterized protein LOC116960074 isoform X1 [Tyto alba]|uniref:uncharacterized protein LOC116960074 isoform X1 n=1 Tax=Tyto alba TaxID=56313 RepID=UPI0014028566|nr:uncharacterized protein LOC116960074 isoform X1 [Tyto alba]XP_032842492.1 uncharacterized protein LOC116960074 isoform X1 [Tyto alba]
MKVLLTLAVLFACSVFTAHGKLPRAFTPGLEGSTVGNLTAHGCHSGWGSSGTSKGSMDRLGDLVPERCLQMRAGSPALPVAGPEAAPAAGAAPASWQMPGTSRAMLKPKGSLQNHLRADKQRDGAARGGVPNPGGSPPLGAFWLRCEDNHPLREAASLYTGSEEGKRRRCNFSAQKNKGGVDTCTSSLQRERWKRARASPLTLISPWLELPVQAVSSLCFLLHCKFSPVAPK